MTDRTDDIQSAFRLNLEQQKKRAKELLQAARSRDAAALARIAAFMEVSRRDLPSSIRLADAQFVVARELRFPSWAGLKAHAAAMERERRLARDQASTPDGEMKTLHVRCGSDIRSTLQEAGFAGDFFEHSNPYCQGPLTKADDILEQRAHFIADSYGPWLNRSFETVRAGLAEEDRRLAASAGDYQRVVLWMEHDPYDQFVLIQTLAHYARTKAPQILELVDINNFPGSVRFIGLGQLPPEAMRLLWTRRRAVTSGQLVLSVETWDALNSDDPGALAAIMRTGTPALPNLTGALHRHLRELPSTQNGLSLTQQLILQVLAAESMSLGRAFELLSSKHDPLPGYGDLMFMRTVDELEQAAEKVIERITSMSTNRFDDQLAITDLGRAVLRGERDWMTLRPPARWVGGVHVEAGRAVWRWDEASREPIRRQSRPERRSGRCG